MVYDIVFTTLPNFHCFESKKITWIYNCHSILFYFSQNDVPHLSTCSNVGITMPFSIFPIFLIFSPYFQLFRFCTIFRIFSLFPACSLRFPMFSPSFVRPRGGADLAPRAAGGAAAPAALPEDAAPSTVPGLWHGDVIWWMVNHWWLNIYTYIYIWYGIYV